nr:immunoglobulin light chain junction region [Macaca mulatta]MOW61727.1 immunoglobulin light chain junction region [Macaca mulatta]MOW61739.1 immunoglobulin light chain junction region [Macaca mulatta]MOW61762.1 immunoglobulin light chain junction region [Macaca mulatta]MOW61862.1 immunoglobulin light chain junction region [Macaca mulatta]
CTQSLEFPWTF